MFTHTSYRNRPQKFLALQTAVAVRMGEEGRLVKKKQSPFTQFLQEEKALFFILQ